jgi:predicted nucleic acid-binding protein
MKNSDKSLVFDAMEKLNNFILDCIIFESTPSISNRAATLAFNYKKKHPEKDKSDSVSSNVRFNKRWHDWWIGATAIEHKLNLVTNNVSDFSDIKEIKIIGPDSKPDELLL